MISNTTLLYLSPMRMSMFLPPRVKASSRMFRITRATQPESAMASTDPETVMRAPLATTLHSWATASTSSRNSTVSASNSISLRASFEARTALRTACWTIWARIASCSIISVRAAALTSRLRSQSISARPTTDSSGCSTFSHVETTATWRGERLSSVSVKAPPCLAHSSP